MIRPGMGALRRRRIIDMIRQLGLDSGLRLCLDVGDANCYNGGSALADLSGGSPAGFSFGGGAAAPTFNGTVGGLSSAEYLQFDGGDYLTYAAANAAWMDALHVDGALWAAAAWLSPGSSGSNQALFGTASNLNSNIGVEVFLSVGLRPQVAIRNGSGTVGLSVVASAALTATVTAWQFFGVSVDEATGADGLRFRLNAQSETANATVSSPSDTAASFTMQIGAGGNNAHPLLAGAKLAALAMWQNSVPSSSEFLALMAASRSRFGI